MSGLANPAEVGSQSLSLMTSSNGAPAKGPSPRSPRDRSVAMWGTPPATPSTGAEVEACLPVGGSVLRRIDRAKRELQRGCPLRELSPGGVPAGGHFTGAVHLDPDWWLSAPAPGTSGANLTMPVLQPLPAGLSIAGQDGGVPTFYSGSPAPMTVRGCRHGTGVVVVRGTDTATGKNVTFLIALTESPIGSGPYSAQLPPLWPVHGDVSIGDYIYCPEAIAPTAGLAAGGTVVTLKGTGFTGATGVRFGTTPATAFKVLSNSLMEAIAPPGSGTVTVSVATPHGLLRGGSLSQYTYISLKSVTPSDGPASGSTEVVIRGQDLGHVNTLWFGDRQATNLKVVSDDEIEALTPPGSGDEPVTIGQIVYGALGRAGLEWPQADPFFPLRRWAPAGPGARRSGQSRLAAQ